MNKEQDSVSLDVSIFPSDAAPPPPYYLCYNIWQRCPICDGVGRIPTDGTATFKACDVCEGRKIISTATGKPPAY